MPSVAVTGIPALAGRATRSCSAFATGTSDSRTLSGWDEEAGLDRLARRAWLLPARTTAQGLLPEVRGMTNGELERLLQAIESKWHDRLSAEVKRIDDLREADLLAREVAFNAVQSVMTGFPEEYARRGDLEAIRETAV